MSRPIIAVFGGSGFIGRHLVQRLAGAGWQVRAAVRDSEGAAFLKPLGGPGQIVPVAVDIMDPGAVASVMAGAVAAVNLVGILYESGQRTFQRLHVEGAANIAKAAAAAGVKTLVHLSAIGADSESPAQYGRSKAAGEAAVREAFAGAVILRPSVVFGPEDAFFNRFAWLGRVSPVLPVIGVPNWPRVICGGDAGLKLDFFGDGGPRFQPVYVGDVADAIMAALEGRADAGAVYELGGPEVMPFKRIMELVMEQTGRQRLLVPVPFWSAALQAAFLQLLPKPLLTRDQVKLMSRDNVVADGARTLADLHIQPVPAESRLPLYLKRFRPQGRTDMRAV